MSGGYVNDPTVGNSLPQYQSPRAVFATAQGTVDFSAGLSTLTGTFSTASASTQNLSGTMDEVRLKTNLANNFVLSGVSFKVGDQPHVAKANGDVQTNLSPVSGNGTKVGTLSQSIGKVSLTAWATGVSPAVTDWRGIAGAPVSGPDSPFGAYGVMFRTAIAPLRPGSFTVLGALLDGTTFNALADSNGKINTSRVKGRVNYQTGVVEMYFTVPSPPDGTAFQDLSFLGIPGVTLVAVDLVQADTLRYNAVAYSYLPLDADLLGIDPVRLPSDGRVPIINVGGLVVVGHSAETAPQTVTNGAVINPGVTRLSRMRLIGGGGATIVGGYTTDLDAGTLTVNDITGYVQPVRVEYRIEDLALVRDAQISGDITLLSPVTHNYPVGSFVSSALTPGNLKARVSLLFDQASWDGTTFSDAVDGTAATGTYNDTLAPIEVTNVGASTERFVLRFTSNTAFEVIGEHVGVIGTGTINTDTSPINPATGEPYFTIRYIGWGGGWSVGNIVRINFVGALFPFWMARTVKQGPNTGLQHSTSILVRANVDRP
jgi:hypothetical protein